MVKHSRGYSWNQPLQNYHLDGLTGVCSKKYQIPLASNQSQNRALNCYLTTWKSFLYREGGGPDCQIHWFPPVLAPGAGTFPSLLPTRDVDAGPHYSFVDTMEMLPCSCRNITRCRNTRAPPNLDSFVGLQNIRTDVLNEVQTLLSHLWQWQEGCLGQYRGMHWYFPKHTPPAEPQRPPVPSLLSRCFHSWIYLPCSFSPWI